MRILFRVREFAQRQSECVRWVSRKKENQDEEGFAEGWSNFPVLGTVVAMISR